MIGLVLGTSEGKELLSKLNEFTDDIFVSTATTYGGSLLIDYKAKHFNTEKLDEKGFEEAIKLHNIKIFIDASHPYASNVSSILMSVCKKLNIMYFRFERESSNRPYKDNYIYINKYEELEDILKSIDGNILNTTGSNNASFINNLPIQNRVVHRVLPDPKIISKLIDCGITIDNIIAIKGPFSFILNDAIIKDYKIKAIITKDSGIASGFDEKINAAIKNNCKIIIIKKPNIEYINIFTNIDILINYVYKIINNGGM